MYTETEMRELTDDELARVSGGMSKETQQTVNTVVNQLSAAPIIGLFVQAGINAGTIVAHIV